MNRTPYIPFDVFDDLHDGAPTAPRSFVDQVLAIVRALPSDFSLRDVYRRARVLQQRFPDNTEIEAGIRAALQTMRDAGLIEFMDNRGHYRLLPTAEPPRRNAA